ncbi:aldo/keto reductase [Streptomyces sp. NBC_01214]|nr:aldo/keto reductase [Streptomyces sp. NBC_01214]
MNRTEAAPVTSTASTPGTWARSGGAALKHTERLRTLGKLAERRGQGLAQLAISWVLRDPRVVSVIIGASSVKQLDQNLDALHGGLLSEEDLAEIDVLSG